MSIGMLQLSRCSAFPEESAIRSRAHHALFEDAPKVGVPVANHKFAEQFHPLQAAGYHAPHGFMHRTFGDNIRPKGKVYNSKWNNTGDSLYLASRDNVLIINPYLQTTDYVINSPAVDILPHPSNPNVLAVLAYDKAAIRLYDLRSGCANSISGKPKAEGTADVSKNKERYLSDNADIRTTTASLISGAWHPDGKTIVVNDKSDVIQAIDISAGFDKILDTTVPAGTPGCRSAPHDIEVGMLCFDTLGEILFATRQNGKVDCYPAAPLCLDPAEKSVVQAHHGYAYCATAAPNGTIIATGGVDQTVNLIDIDSLSSLGSIAGLASTVSSLSFSHRSSWLALGTKQPTGTNSDGNLRPSATRNSMQKNIGQAEASEWSVSIATVEPLEIVKTLTQNSPIAAVHWHPTRDILAVASENTGPGVESSNSSKLPSTSRQTKNHVLGLLSLE